MYSAVAFGSPLLTSTEYPSTLQRREIEFKRETRISPKDSWREPVSRRLEARAEFERLVQEAIDSLPEEFASRLSNVAIVVEDNSPDPRLLGLYRGIPQPKRESYGGVLPDVITIYRRPIESRARTPEDLAREVRITVLHEIAHHFGISDERLRELGW